MARILERALRESVKSDIIYIMAAKISRRTLKLAIGDEAPGMKYVYAIVEATHRELAKRWKAIEHDFDPLGLQQTWNTSRLSFNRDIELSLLNLRSYHASILTRARLTLDTLGFKPKESLRIMPHSSSFPRLKHFKEDSGYTGRLCLMDIELWVQDSLKDWLHANLTSQNACTLLAELIHVYTTSAFSIYAENPEDISMMLLTTMDLWVALDKCAIEKHPLIIKYESGFPQLLLDPLLLPKKAQLEPRLEQYIQQRRSDSLYESSLIF